MGSRRTCSRPATTRPSSRPPRTTRSSASRAATARSRRWRRRASSATQPSSACPSGRGTTSRATSASTADDPLAALASFAPDAEERRVDVGRADGRVFLNNVSFGLYAGLVHERERRRRRREAFARLKALGRLAATRHRATILIDGAPVDAPLALVANNSYTPVRALSLGERERLDEGRLHLYVAVGAWPGAWQERTLERLELDARDGAVRAAIDGEPAELETPLELTVDPLALRLRLPSPER